jgi:hypothetical protein
MRHAQSLKRTTIAVVVLLATPLVAWAVLYLSPSAADAIGIGIGRTDTVQSFHFNGYTVQLAGAYADSFNTVIDLKGAPPGVVFGATYLNDQFGNLYPEENAEASKAGDMALNYKPATWLTTVAGMRYTLTITQPSDTSATRTSTLKGIVRFNTAPRLQIPASGSFANGEVTFVDARYGAEVVAIGFEVRGVSVVRGYPPSEASVKPRPSLDVRLAPIDGGPTKNMPYRASVSGGVTQVHAIAMLVDPGTYSLVVSLEGVANLQRTLVVS